MVMSFYGNQIIETSRSFSNINIYPTSFQEDYVSLTPTTQESALYIMPKDPWIAMEADAIMDAEHLDTLYIYHTSTAQRLENTLNLSLNSETNPRQKILDDSEVSNPYLTNYCIKYTTEEHNLIAGDTFITLAPIDQDQEVMIDNAGHLLNAKFVKYHMPDAFGLEYDKDPWVQAMFGVDEAWYTLAENKTKYNIDPKNIGYIPDLYEKMKDITTGLTGENPEDPTAEPAEPLDLSELISAKNEVEILKAKLTNLYDPDNNYQRRVGDAINATIIEPSPMSKVVKSIKDCRLAERNADGEIDNQSDYLDTRVIQILKGITDCAFDKSFLEDSSKLLKDEIPLLKLIEELKGLKDTLEAFFGLNWVGDKELSAIQKKLFIETAVTEIEFLTDPQLYYIYNVGTSSFNQQNSESVYDANIKYYTKLKKNLVPIEMTPEIWNANRQNLYIEYGAGSNIYYIKIPQDTADEQVLFDSDLTYYIYTGYSKASCKNILDAVECYVGTGSNAGYVSETITAYIQKLNSAR